MRCDAARRVLSDRIDDPVEAALDVRVEDHLATCSACARFDQHLQDLRRQLRVGVLQPPPDIAGAVRVRLQDRPATRVRARRWHDVARVAAVFVAAFALGAAAVGLGGPRDVRAIELTDLVHAGQAGVESLHAEVRVTERGWHPDVPERSYAGTLTYRAPETLGLRLQDQTAYPHAGWHPNDVDVVVDESTAWTRGRVGCPASALPDCLSASPRTTVVTGREPFDATEPVPLDLVVPVASFGTATTVSDAATTTVDGRRAIEVVVPVAQLHPMLDAVLRTGTWRQLHPHDRATVALDATYGVPLRVSVRADRGSARQQWAAAHGYDDPSDAPLWSWTLGDVAVNVDDPEPPPCPPDGVEDPVDRGFRPRTLDQGLARSEVPAGLSPHRSGTVGDVAVASWSDGRAWLRIRVHRDWSHTSLFGRRGGQLVRRVELPSGGVAYVAEGGSEVFVHGRQTDVAIAGSVPTEQLLHVADDLQVQGSAVPRTWTEAAGATLDQARRAVPRLLVASQLAAFTGPGVRVADGTVTLSYAGNGNRGFVLVQTDRPVLTPPLDDVVFGVRVRGVDGRFTPGTGTLEWLEGGRTVTLRSTTLALPELLALAERLEHAP